MQLLNIHEQKKPETQILKQIRWKFRAAAAAGYKVKTNRTMENEKSQWKNQKKNNLPSR